MVVKSRVRVAALVALAFLAGVAAVLLIQSSHSHSGPVRGSGVEASQARKVASFTAVELAGSNRVIVRVGSPQAVTVQGDDNLLRFVTTRVSAGRLVIGSRRNYETRAPMAVVVTTPALNAVALSGSGIVQAGDVQASRFGVTLAGSGIVNVSGHATALDASIAGSGELQLEQLAARDARAEIDGSGSIRLNVSGSLDGTVKGSGQISYVGNPAQVRSHVTGSGSVG